MPSMASMRFKRKPVRGVGLDNGCDPLECCDWLSHILGWRLVKGQLCLCFPSPAWLQHRIKCGTHVISRWLQTALVILKVLLTKAYTAQLTMCLNCFRLSNDIWHQQLPSFQANTFFVLAWKGHVLVSFLNTFFPILYFMFVCASNTLPKCRPRTCLCYLPEAIPTLEILDLEAWPVDPGHAQMEAWGNPQVNVTWGQGEAQKPLACYGSVSSFTWHDSFFLVVAETLWSWCYVEECGQLVIVACVTRIL